MEPKAQSDRVEAYLADETQLYQDWFKGFNPIENDPEAVAVSILPSFKALKKRFKKWFDKNQEFFREIICVKWGYLRQKAQFQKEEALIVAMATDCLAANSFMPPAVNTLAVCTVLVIEGYLDTLCAECSKL
ncbi:MAG: hypothetical protein DRR19_22725 [Candidatus Parabeggiatoa sp. nov. 1]|nr:MAG: hypothetical protein DRR19_22725 [Gammaproteobacteria bacterium]